MCFWREYSHFVLLGFLPGEEMAVDDEIVLEAKAARLSQSTQGRGRVLELVLSATVGDVLDAYDRRCTRGDAGSAVLEYTRALLYALGPIARSNDAANANAAGLLLRVVLKVLDLVHSRMIPGDKKAVECVSLLAQEIESLPSRLLPSVADAILNNLQSDSFDDEYLSLQLLPPCLNLISRSVDQVVVSAEDGEEVFMSGEEYVDKFVDCIIAMRWSNMFLTKMASLIRELPLEASHVERLMKKTFSCMKHLEPQDLPALVYQLLLLASKGFKQIALEGIVSFFSKMQKQGDKNQKMEILHQVVGTVVLHFNFAVKQDPTLGQELLSMLRSSFQPLSPFMVSVLLSIARVQRFEQASLDILKTAVVTAYRNSQHCRDSKWAFSVIGEECLQRTATIQQSFLKTVETSTFGWEHIAPSVVKVGFLLIESGVSGKPIVGGDPRKWDSLSGGQNLGTQVLLTAFKVHEIARDEIIEQSKCRIIGLRPHESYPIIRMLVELIQSCPLLMLDHASRLKECLDYFTFLHPCSAALLVQAICPLFQLSADLQDYTVLVLRKAMFSREITARMTAVQGLLDLLVMEKQSRMFTNVDSLHSTSEASCSQSCSQREGRIDPGKSMQLLRELLGLFRRCLSQQASVKEVLYKGLPKLLLVDPGVAEIIFDLLWPHFSQFYEAGDDNRASIKLEACVTLKNDIIQIQEPLDQLLCCIHQLLGLQPQKGLEEQSAYAWTSFGFSLSQGKEVVQVSSGESLSVALLNLRKGMQASTLDNIGLEKFEAGTTDGLQNIEQGCILLGVLEALINVATLETLNTENEDREGNQAEKEIRSYVVLHESLSEKLSKRQGKGNAKSSMKTTSDSKAKSCKEPGDGPAKQNSFAVPQALLEKRKPLLSSTCISCLLHIVLQSEGFSEEPAPQKSVKDADVRFACFTLKACLNHFKGAESENVENLQTTSDLKHLLGNDWKRIGEPLFKVLLLMKSATSATQTQMKCKDREKSTKGKKICAESFDGLMLIGLKSLDALLRFADRRSCLHAFLKTIQHGLIGEQHLDDLGGEGNDEEEQEQKLLHDLLSKHLTPLLQDLVNVARYPEIEVIAGTILFLSSKLPPFLMKSHGAWADKLCREHNVNNPGAARSIARLAISLSVPPADGDIAQSMGNELLKVMGTDETDAVPSSEKYLVINNSTRIALAGLLLQQMEVILSDIEWLVSSLKSHPKAMQHLNRVRQEESLHTRLEALVSILSAFMNMTLSDSLAEQALRIAVKLYKNLASATRLCIAPKGFKQSVPTSRFQKLAETTCKSLTRPVYTFVAIMQRDRQEKLQVKGAVNKIKREGKTIPNLIYHVEDYEKNLIQLSKLTKVNLMRHAKRSTARDFKILENTKAPTDEQQNADDGDEGNADETTEPEDEAEEGAETLEARDDEKDSEEERPTVRRGTKQMARRTVQDSDESDDETSPKKQRTG